MTNKSARLNNRRFFQDRNSDLTVFYVFIVLICFVVLVLTGCDNNGNQPKLNNIVKPEKAEFVDRQSCISNTRNGQILTMTWQWMSLPGKQFLVISTIQLLSITI